MMLTAESMTYRGAWEMQLESFREPGDFSPEQETRLSELGLFPEQIDALDQIVPVCRALLRPPATMTNVRGKLTEVAQGLRRAYEIATGPSIASVEVRSRLELAAAQAVEAQIKMRNSLEPAAAEALSDPLSDLDIVSRLRSLTELAEEVLRALPPQQRRSNDASPLPIERIEDALLQGFLDHHRGAAFLPPHEIRTSVTKPPFPQIAAIVYEAIGRKSEAPEPERAIKAYIALDEERRLRRTTNVKVVTRSVSDAESGLDAAPASDDERAQRIACAVFEEQFIKGGTADVAGYKAGKQFDINKTQALEAFAFHAGHALRFFKLKRMKSNCSPLWTETEEQRLIAYYTSSERKDPR